jgi:hypothetical protein
MTPSGLRSNPICPEPAKRRQRFAQFVDLGIGELEAATDDRNPHRLFLEQRNPQGFRRASARNSSGGPCSGEGEGSPAPAHCVASNERVNHIALDRPRPDDRHLDHQIVEAARFHPAAASSSAPGFPPGTPQPLSARHRHVVSGGIFAAAPWRANQSPGRWCFSNRSNALWMHDSIPRPRHIHFEQAERCRYRPCPIR